MSKLPWYRLWVVEHQSEAARWTAEDEGYCLRLMNAMWQVGMEGDVPPGLPDDPAAICELIGCTERQWDRLRRKFLLSPQTPFTISAGTISHKRLTDEWAHALDKSGKAKESAEKRWHPSTNRNANAMRTHSGRNARDDASGMLSQNTELRTQNTEVVGTPKLQVSMLGSEIQTCAILDFENDEQENATVETALALRTTTPARSNGRKQYPPEFEAFWESYPNKTGKDAAYRAWRTQQRNLPDTATLTAIVQAHRTGNTKWLAGYIPNPATWLNQGRWQDALTLERQPDPLKQALAEGR